MHPVQHGFVLLAAVHLAVLKDCHASPHIVLLSKRCHVAVLQGLVIMWSFVGNSREHSILMHRTRAVLFPCTPCHL
eukprot:scaffold244344_cov26-Tisochrysis_lutea.AAC.1